MKAECKMCEREDMTNIRKLEPIRPNRNCLGEEEKGFSEMVK